MGPDWETGSLQGWLVKMMMSSWRRGAPNPTGLRCYKSDIWTQARTQGHPCEDGGRDGGEAPRSQGTPEMASRPLTPEKGWNGLPLPPQKKPACPQPHL